MKIIKKCQILHNKIKISSIFVMQSKFFIIYIINQINSKIFFLLGHCLCKTDFTYQTFPGGDFLSTKNTLKKEAKFPNVMTTDRGISVSKKAKIVADLVPKMPASRKQF